MKKQFLYALTALAVLAGLWACEDKGNNVKNDDGLAPTVEVGAQIGDLLADQAGSSVTFPVTTENVEMGMYTVSVSGLPDGVGVTEPSVIWITDNGTGFLSLSCGDTAEAGTTDNLVLTLLGAQSNEFSLTVINRSLTVGAQEGQMYAGVAGSVTFAITTENVVAGDYTVSVANRPQGVTVDGPVTIDAQGEGTLTLTGDETTIEGVISTLTLTLNGTTSSNFTLTIIGKGVSLGAQSGTLVAGKAGSVTFSVTTTNVVDTTYPVTLTGAPTGVSASDLTISGGTGTLTLTGDTSTVAGVIDDLTITIDEITSAQFTLTIVARTVSVGAQSGNMLAGEAGTVTFPVTTQHIAANDYNVTLNNGPTGVTVQGQVTIAANGSGTLTLAGNSSTTIGSTATLTLTLDGITSAAFTLKITGPPTITIGTQNGAITAGKAISIIAPVWFSITTENINNGERSNRVASDERVSWEVNGTSKTKTEFEQTLGILFSSGVINDANPANNRIAFAASNGGPIEGTYQVKMVWTEDSVVTKSNEFTITISPATR